MTDEEEEKEDAKLEAWRTKYLRTEREVEREVEGMIQTGHEFRWADWKSISPDVSKLHRDQLVGISIELNEIVNDQFSRLDAAALNNRTDDAWFHRLVNELEDDRDLWFAVSYFIEEKRNGARKDQTRAFQAKSKELQAHIAEGDEVFA